MSSKIIGITGGIGTGKSTVSGILANVGAYVIDSDKIARQVVQKGQKALEEITIIFGGGVLKEDGELDRIKLAKLVFNNEKNLEVLNEITHKYIIEEIFYKLSKAKNGNLYKQIVIEAPIPIKNGFIDCVDTIWVVTADMETRIKRVIERSGFEYQDVLNRINLQDEKYDYLGLADVVIANDGTLNELQEKVEKLYYI
jgi:dephospho-CoA kinase